MESTIRTLIESRVSLNYYDPDRPVSEAQIKELVRLATLAPSAYNLQNWKFIVVQSAEAKQRLKTVAYGQQKVETAPVTFIVCGLLEAHRQLPLALRPAVDAGIIAPSVSDAWVAAAARSHDGNPVLQRDEAFRSASLAAMTLILAAEGMGLGSGSMSGFDPLALSGAFGLSEAEVPVMLITVGYPAAGNWPQKPRRPAQDVMQYV
ncbi:nitroreductase family protein [Allopusillimonas ginsengisoli]|uniref:nitroreductase family protein n=1 Tax=Allopusillimonas ginsengisoli TaxID=453575 RepID=UPI001021F20E|nr:nitroreductase family protein [Allopusillimonas ginsengisoli]TEA78964.1 nitroreductase family protein [Allopusillimonas ginsengisoli]